MHFPLFCFPIGPTRRSIAIAFDKWPKCHNAECLAISAVAIVRCAIQLIALLCWLKERRTNTAEQRFLHCICTRRQALGIFYIMLRSILYIKVESWKKEERAWEFCLIPVILGYIQPITTHISNLYFPELKLHRAQGYRMLWAFNH